MDNVNHDYVHLSTVVHEASFVNALSVVAFALSWVRSIVPLLDVAALQVSRADFVSGVLAWPLVLDLHLSGIRVPMGMAAVGMGIPITCPALFPMRMIDKDPCLAIPIIAVLVYPIAVVPNVAGSERREINARFGPAILASISTPSMSGL